MLTADATADQSRRLRAAGAFAYMTKPLEISEVLRLVDDRLHDRHRDDEIQ
jgi:DNA-binding NtrC family response regulator